MILFCHFLEEFTVEIIDETIENKTFDAAIMLDGCEDEFYVRLKMPSGETKKSIGFTDEQIDRFKRKLLPMHETILKLIEYAFDRERRDKYYRLSLRAQLIDPDIRLLELISPFDRAKLERERYCFVHCNLHDMYYDETATYRYTGFEFVNDAGGVINWSHLLDMALYEYADVSIAKFSTEPSADRLHEFIGEMYLRLEDFPEYTIRIDEFELRSMLTNTHINRELQLDLIYHTDRENIYRVKLVCAPDGEVAYIFLKGEIRAPPKNFRSSNSKSI